MAMYRAECEDEELLGFWWLIRRLNIVDAVDTASVCITKFVGRVLTRHLK